MTKLTVYRNAAPYDVRQQTGDRAAIAAALAPFSIVLERWDASMALSDAMTDADILAAYAGPIDRLKASGGYRSCDVVRLTPDHPQRAEMRAKFLAEHIHEDDEVRFFVEGSGLFYIRGERGVHALECTAGDLIVLPAGTRHWFDTGERPFFTAIRLFTTPDGWVARFTGDTISESIPLYEGAS